MTNYETFVLAVVYIALAALAIVVVSAGGLLTITAAGICLVGYYPIRLFDWVINKVKGISK